MRILRLALVAFVECAWEVGGAESHRGSVQVGVANGIYIAVSRFASIISELVKIALAAGGSATSQIGAGAEVVRLDLYFRSFFLLTGKNAKRASARPHNARSRQVLLHLRLISGVGQVVLTVTGRNGPRACGRSAEQDMCMHGAVHITEFGTLHERHQEFLALFLGDGVHECHHDGTTQHLIRNYAHHHLEVHQ